MSYYVYILKGKNGYLYTGITWNLKKRLFEHNNGIRSSLPNSQKPFKIVFSEVFSSRLMAAKREKQLKGWRRSKKEKLIEVYTE